LKPFPDVPGGRIGDVNRAFRGLSVPRGRALSALWAQSVMVGAVDLLLWLARVGLTASPLGIEVWVAFEL
jgi:hypothetical protein